MDSERTLRSLFAAHALLPHGWATDVLLEWNDCGALTCVTAQSIAPRGVMEARGPVLPGLCNLHSHAFQRGFAGLSEARDSQHDDFWSWRSQMYRFALRVSPKQLERIATWLYIEMLEAGYTSVCEFHYLHHDRNGRAYADDALLASTLLSAAGTAGIGLTLLPALYQCSGFGGQPSVEEQRRFIHSAESILRLCERLRPLCHSDRVRLGFAIHSLRAVMPHALREALAGVSVMDGSAPIHIHVAEQTREVEACLAWSGQRPVEWLLDHVPVDRRWCMVHATHMNAAEYQSAARSGAVVGLTPSTEANLGDGIFDLPRWQQCGGMWGLGSDSHVCVNAAEELLLLEYEQRLLRRERNVLATREEPHTATAMLLQAVRGGAQASGRPVAGLAPGQQADFVVLDARHPALHGLSAPAMLSGHVFACHRTSAVDSVWAQGVQRVSGVYCTSPRLRISCAAVQSCWPADR